MQPVRLPRTTAGQGAVGRLTSSAEQVSKVIQSLEAKVEWTEALTRLRNDHHSSQWQTRLGHLKVRAAWSWSQRERVEML